MNSISAALFQGVLTSAELRHKLAISPATLMRVIRRAGPQVIPIGRGRASRYGWVQTWQGLSMSRFPMFRITENGTAESAGELLTLASHQTAKIPEGDVTNGLPIEIADMRPSGFLGRYFAATHADLQLPLRLLDWSDHHILVALSRRGEDLTGNLILGDETFARWQGLEVISKSLGDYPTLAIATIAGHPPGSSAGGERPKFGAFVEGRHVLVKFSARGESSDLVSRRWCDLLVLEALALDAVSTHAIPTARTRLIMTDSHFFLESERFDRVGMRGRVAVLSLAAIHEDIADSWSRAAVHLRNTRRLVEEEASRLRWLDAFGALIANTDRHPYNIVFFSRKDALHLAPVFDQTPMFYAPTADGQMPSHHFVSPRATPDTLAVWDDARSAAGEFWQRASDDARISDDMRRVSLQNAKLLKE